MRKKCQLRFAQTEFKTLYDHLFPGDGDEHGAVLLAGICEVDGVPILTVREVHLAIEGVDYLEGKIGYRALNPQFIHKLITRARDEKLVYLAVHNHFSDLSVGFSRIDLDSHELGYPALLQISRGTPVGAVVLGKRSIQADIWFADGERVQLEKAVVIGQTIQQLTPSPKIETAHLSQTYDRQIRLFGEIGQLELGRSRIGIIGLGGIGILLVEYLSRLGVGDFVLIDPDRIESSNLSRLVGASQADVVAGTTKVGLARRIVVQANPSAKIEGIEGDVATESVAMRLRSCDYLFLAADSMRARLVFNAIVHQYLIPGVQLGSKVRAHQNGEILDVMSANRPVRPGTGCLWCNELIDQTELAKEAKTDEERKDQAYGVQEPNPSVITLNAISASHAANDFLMDYLQIRPDRELYYEHNHFLNAKRSLVIPRSDEDCTECSRSGVRFARGDTYGLPCMAG